jgi:putative CocE/NonD family hydrolase
MSKVIDGREYMDIKVIFNIPVKMRDGVTLYMDVYRPDNEKPYPAIVNRTPYLKDGFAPLNGYVHAHLLAARGYNVVIQDVRGTGHSEGVCDPAGHQDEDGYDTVEAIAAMPWCDGHVGMVGESYHGFSQLACGRANPPHLDAICPFMTSWTKFPAIYDFGIFSPVLYGWIYSVALARKAYYPDEYPESVREEMKKYIADMPAQLSYLSMKDMPAANIDGVPELQFQRELLENIDNEDYLRSIGRAEGFEQTMVPTLNVTGWLDFLRDKTIYNFTQFRKRGGSEACRKGSMLIVGPWLHSDRMEGSVDGNDFGPEGSGDGFGMNDKIAQWYDHWSKGKENPFTSGAPIHLFVMGKNVWRDEWEWPLARTKYVSYYFHSGGSANTLDGDGWLSTSFPAEEEPDHYDYDPMDPCPSDTGELYHSFMQDQRLIQKRKDVLVYTTKKAAKEVEITGPIVVRLYAATSARDTDFVARVSIVRTDGRVTSIGSKLVRCRYRNGHKPEPMVAGEVCRFDIEAANICMVLKPGEAVRVDITSSLFPDADRNMNTFGKVGYEDSGIVARQTICHDPEHPSCVILPVIPQ